ncbi:uncharacterized protein LOC110456241 [Mizuhopecten yessoensis]|uniref:Uncharacterized protein n=1 Tax=Mizuhopecten yessoensis TaxID=6573 RepID=A0A210QBD7_MIZYE|nr:uncharacterized protein LOC110456241 [Mizuhopecten yessoensis]OWF46048.1 hypothetical protein KP79_PYT03778 [Mizuhopecten yessoensis]
MGITHTGDDFVDNNYPVKVKSHQPAHRPSSNFPVDTFDLRVHALIGYMEKAVRRPIINHVLYDETDESDDDDIESDTSSGEETSEYEEETDDDKEETETNSMYTKNKDLASFFTEKDGSQEPYDVYVRFAYSSLPDDNDERISQATQTENDPAEPANPLLELFSKKENESESVKKSKFACFNCFRVTHNDDDEDVKETTKSVKRESSFRKVFGWFQRFQRWINF